MKRKKERKNSSSSSAVNNIFLCGEKKKRKVVAEKYLVSTVLPYGDHNNNILLHTKPSPLHFISPKYK